MRVVRALLALLAATGVVLALGPPPSARAAEPEALVSITLTSLTPDLPERDGQVTVRGRVENITEQRLFRLQAIFWRDQSPVTSAEGVQQALQSESNVPIGARKTEVYQDLYTPANPYLEPGETATFSLTADVADLQLPPTDGVYLMGVHVLQNGTNVAVGRARTFVPVLQGEPAQKLQLTSLVVLTSRPSLLRRGVLSDDHLADEVRPGGRLAQLLESADSAGVSFAVDPALVEELETMRGGYLVAAGDGSTTTGRGQSDATAWLQRFTGLTRTRDGFALLYGSPDVAALVHDRQTSVLQDAVAAGRRVAATRGLPLLVLPAEGRADEATLLAAEQLDPAAVVLADSSAVGDGPLLDGVGEAPVVRFSSTGSGGGPGPDPRDTPVQVRQRVLTDTWVEASTSSDGSTRGRVRLVTGTNQVQDDDAGVAAPWLSRTTLSELLAGTPATWDGELTYPAEAREAELTPAQLGSQRRLVTSYATYAELLVDPAEATASGQAAVARAASVAWRRQERLRTPYLEQQQTVLDDLLQNQLRISTNPKVSTVAREGVEFPITVQNLLPADEQDPDVNAVRLRLVFVSENRQRLTIRPIEAPLVRAGANLTANAQVTAKANGTVPVRAQLQTLDGTPVGRPRTIDVRVTQNGTTGWAIAATALVLFGGGTALRIKQVGRSRARTDGDAVAAPSALTSAPPADAPAASRPATATADQDGTDG